MAATDGGVNSSPISPWSGQRRPLSVVVLGNSLAVLQLPERQNRSARVYLEVLADCLAAAGVPVHAHLEARWFDFLVRAGRDYESRVRNHLPDVLIIHFGLNEYQPWLVPVWLIRHLLRRNDAVTRPARVYRARMAPLIWHQVRSFRRWASPRVGTRTWQTTPRRFTGHLANLIRKARWELAPLIIVMDLDEPGGLLETYLPGMIERRAVYQQALESAVASVGHPDVRLFRVSEVTRALGPGAMPDSMHYSPAAHRRIGELLADEVLSWLAAQKDEAGDSPTG